jgi:hypothetical protein
MKKWLAAGLAAALCGAVWAEDGFWAQLTPEERAAAGLAQLTPEQQAALDGLAVRFAREGARRAREEARTEAAAQAREEARARIGLTPPENEQIIRSRIKGQFKGWSRHQLFLLENGQRWKVVDNESRWFPTMTDPEVQIEPGILGSWKMRLVSEGLWVRVRRVE